MNERLPYEIELAQQWHEVSPPDENLAWTDMKRRLDEDDDDRAVPIWLRGCLLWTVSGIFLLVIGWWILHPENWFKHKMIQHPDFVRHAEVKARKDSTQKLLDSQKPDSASLRNPYRHKRNVEAVKETGRRGNDKLNNNKKTTGFSKKDRPGYNDKRDDRYQNSDTVSSEDKKNDSVEITNEHKQADNSSNTIATISHDTTSTKKTKADSLTHKNKVAEPRRQKSDSSKPTRFSFAAGVSLQQQLPINGQKLVPYNSAGRKGTLADYIPSIYARIYKGDKWFIQSEFHYAAPEYTKEFLYKQKIVSDTVRQRTTTTSTRLKKTFYDELPLTFNVFVFKNLSLGGGVVWNKFVSAVTDQDIVQHSNQTGTDSIVSKGTIITPKRADSNFVNSYFQLMFESQYKWKRFSIGAKYAFGLQPYIKFSVPGGASREEKNSSIKIFLRYELWRSGKK